MGIPTTNSTLSASERLREDLQKGDLILFIGAGLSMGAGLPGWIDLIRSLAKEVGYQGLPPDDKFITPDHLLAAAQFYEDHFHSRHPLIQRLRDNLKTTNTAPTAIHELIASRLQVHIIFTTNYDDLIERALRDANRQHNVIINKEQLPFWSEAEVQAIKLCGCLTQPDSIFITKQDFNTYTHSTKAQHLAFILRATLWCKTPLFLGYSLQDPFFNQIWDHIGLDFGRHRRIGYAVLFDASDCDDLERRGIHVVNLATEGQDKTQLLENWLRELIPLTEPGKTTLPRLPPSIDIPRLPDVGFVKRRNRLGDLEEQVKRKLLDSNECRMVALWGGGGVGKTALAVKVARDLIGLFANRIIWIEARPDFSLSMLLDEIAQKLSTEDLQHHGLEHKKDLVRALVAAPSTLLVLDNFDIIEETEQKLCAEWIDKTRCPAIITTRNEIRHDEIKMDVVSSILIPKMWPDEACEFMERLIAQSRQQDTLTSVRDRVINVAEANPLILRWVVGQINLAQDPDDVLRELERGKGKAAERVFGRSFNLPQLREDGRDVLLALSLFVPNALRPDLAYVAGFIQPDSVWQRSKRFISNVDWNEWWEQHKKISLRDHWKSEWAKMCFVNLTDEEIKRLNEAVKPLSSLWLLEMTEDAKRLFVADLTRMLAQAKLARDTEKDKAFRQRFVEYYLHFAEAYEQPTPENFAALESEKGNLVNAINVAAGMEDWEGIIQLMECIFTAGAANFLSPLSLMHCKKAVKALLNKHAEAKIMRWSYQLAMRCQEQCMWEEALELYQLFQDANKKLGNEIGIAHAISQIGIVLFANGKVKEARDKIEKSLAIWRKRNDQRCVASDLYHLGRIDLHENKRSEAQSKSEESLRMFENLGAEKEQAAVLEQLCIIAQDVGDWDKAKQLFIKRLEIVKKLENKNSIVTCLRELWRIEQKFGNKAEAMQRLDEALNIFKQPGAEKEQAELLDQLASMAQDEGDLNEAKRLSFKRLKIARKFDGQNGIATCLRRLGRIEQKLGNMAEAERQFREALSIFESIDSPEAGNVKRDLESLESDS